MHLDHEVAIVGQHANATTEDRLVERERSEEDRRVVVSRITKQGLALLAELDEPITALQKSLLAHMSRSELRQFLSLMERVRESA